MASQRHARHDFEAESPTVLTVGSEETARAVAALGPEYDDYRPPDPAAALALVGQVDCVVATHDLPGEWDGLRLFATIRERSAHLPFVLVTEPGDDRAVVREAFQRGITAHVRAGGPAPATDGGSAGPDDGAAATDGRPTATDGGRLPESSDEDGEPREPDAQRPPTAFVEALRDRIEVAVDHAATDRERVRRRTAVETTTEPAATVDADGTIRAANDAYAELFGDDLETLVGGSLSRHLPEGDADRLRRAGTGVDTSGGDATGGDDPWYGSCVAFHADGRVLRLRAAVSPLPDGGFTLLLADPDAVSLG
ncbi:PAS domain-containing protein [Halobaculum sp. MBLA0147]|uniref:PAS domain-containing protein n=1 Tax=Halobaculum sp. MBLA0147 TaxID=3079934 RepID=UPI00352586D9